MIIRHVIKEYFRRVIGKFEKSIEDPSRKTPLAENVLHVLEQPLMKDVFAGEMSEPDDELERISEKTLEEIIEKGLDVVAFYLPYHLYGGIWGIYFYETKLLGLSYRVWKNCSNGFLQYALL